ncbi:MAG: type I DNA topoisomerase, partial [Thermaceae bacterium]|nr:type I DNA topoisomerase [Thermaceae bacterium]
MATNKKTGGPTGQPPGTPATPATRATTPSKGNTPSRPPRSPRSPRAQRASSSGPSWEASAAGRSVLIVESPAKAKTIARYLGSGFVVEASFGHVRDLPKSELGVDVDHAFAPKYEVPPDKSARVKRLKELVKAATSVYLATDPDREGEAIAWHVQQVTGAGRGGQPVYRVEFHEITQGAVQHAVQHPRSINTHLVDAQQARRVLDRLVGYKISPLLWEKVGRGLSAGRVQSVAVRLVVEREREIVAFVPQEYWSIEADLSKRPRGKPGYAFHAQLVAVGGKKIDLKTGQQANSIVSALQGAEYQVERVTTKEVQRRPSPPFITSSLQQEASRKLGMPAKKTMQVAQNLYEGVEPFGGLITYMRTDSTNVAAEAQAAARKVISGRFGGQYVPASPPVYQKKVAGAQEAHEAIRPTHPERDPESLSGKLDRDQLRLYTLIWRRFIASQMANAVLDQTSVDIGAGPAGSAGALGTAAPRPYTFRASGSVIKFQGFLAVYREGRDAGDPDDDLDKNALPQLEKGEGVDLIKLWPEQHFTQPPPRYTEPTLVKALEEKGIGRPSTYASILSTIQEREYVEMKDKKFQSTSLGETVNDLLVARFPRILDVGFTAAMEGELDEVADGKRAWLPVVAGFYDPLVQALEEARQSVGRVQVQVQERGKGPGQGQGRVQLVDMTGTGTGTGKPIKPASQPKPQPTGEECPQCGSPMVVRQGP